MNGQQTDAVRQHFICHGSIVDEHLDVGRCALGGHVGSKPDGFDTGHNETPERIHIGYMDGR